MTDEKEWKRRIGELILVKQRIAEVDSEGIWPHRLPRVAATEAKLREVERHLGEPLDPDYRTFLSCAGGWPAFFQTVDLFGPEELLGDERFGHAAEMLGYVEESVLQEAGVRREHLLPIAASPVDLDLFVMTRRSSPQPGIVIWLAGAEIDRFPSFDEFFLSMTEYNRREVQALQKRARG